MASIERIRQDIETLAKMTDSEIGTTRLSYSPAYRKGIEYIKQRMRETGLVDIHEDGIGTLYGTLPGKDSSKGIIITGSHLDSVSMGGNYDGAGGIVCSLEAINMLKEEGCVLDSPVVLVVTCMEEGARFPGLCGSRFMVGMLGEKELDSFKDYDGITLRKAINDYGLSGNISDVSIANLKIKAFIELHIELSTYLDDIGADVGIVDSIFGGERLHIIYNGKVTHPSKPYHKRQDPSIAMCETVTQLTNWVKEEFNGKAMVTVGRINVYPNTANAVPKKVDFYIDVRSNVKEYISEIRKKTNEIISNVNQKYHVLSEFESELYKEPAIPSEQLENIIEASANGFGYKTVHMDSGAAHDAMIISRICPVGMLFVPNIGGLIHCPEEYTSIENLVKGANVIAETIKRIDKQN